MENSYYVLSETSRIVHGYFRSCIYDLVREKYEFYPKNILELIQQFNKNTIQDILDFVPIQHRNILKDWINILKCNEHIIVLENSLLLNNFPPLDLTFEIPNIIQVCILEIENASNFSENSFDILDQVGVNSLFIYFKGDLSLDDEKAWLEKFSEIRATNISLIFDENSIFNKSLSFWQEINSRINLLFFLTENCEENYQSEEDIVLIKRNRLFCDAPPQNSDLFLATCKFYLESFNYNPYFHSKIYVNANGEVFNTPESTQRIAILENTTVDDFLDNYKKLTDYTISKSSISICCDCEFRFMCEDRRNISVRKNGSYFYKSECNYNPYICKWEGEEGYQTLEDCGVICNQDTFSINHEKIAAINEILWAD